MTIKTALITGASVGIGRATAHALAEDGYQLILLARRGQKLAELASELPNTPCHLIACDINDKPAIDAALKALPKQFQVIDVLVNNAGLALGVEPTEDTLWEDWLTMIETNCIALAYLSRKILPQMKQRNSGYIVNMGSTAGSYHYRGGNVYGATKAFVDHFSMNLRTDLFGTQVRVCNLQPGLISDTEFSLVRFHGDEKAAKDFYAGSEPLSPQDVAEAVRWVVAQPPHVNINRLEMMPTCQAPAGLAVSRSS